LTRFRAAGAKPWTRLGDRISLPRKLSEAPRVVNPLGRSATRDDRRGTRRPVSDEVGAAELRELDLGAQFDMRDDRVQRRVAGGSRIRQGAGEAAEIGGRNGAAQERRLQLVERVEKVVPALCRPAATLGRIFFRLQLQDGVERGEGRGRARRSGLGRGLFVQAEPRCGRFARPRCRRDRGSRTEPPLEALAAA